MAVSKIQYSIGNAASTTTAGSIASGGTSGDITATTNFQAKSGEGMILINEGGATEEIAYSTGLAGSTLALPTANRGLEGGSAQAHLAGETVKGVLTAGMWNNLIDSVLNLLNQSDGSVKATAISSGNLASWDGWQTANEAWTYASATTITVPSDATTKYAIGDRIKLTQSATVKYFYVVGVASTVLTITGGSDYTFTNNAITSNYYSHSASPLNFPQWFNFTTTPTGFSANPTYISRFNITARMCTVAFRTLSAGTSNATTFTVSVPVTTATITNMFWGTNFWNSTDNSVNTANPGRAYIGSNSTTITVGKANNADNNWTASGTKEASFVLSYEI